MFLKRRLLFVIIVCLSSLLIISIPGCCSTLTSAKYADNPITQRETLVQISTIGALINGIYDGVLTAGELKKYGDLGIGTFEGLDGEMVDFDGDLYQVKADGIAYPVSDFLKIPFACVTFFDTDYQEKLPKGINYKELEEFLDSTLPTINVFYAIKIEGTFSHMKTRSVPGQVRPYPPLVEVTKNQPIFEFSNIRGTIVGFRCPPYVSGVNVVGYHLHFLTENKDGGGHVLDFGIKDATALVDYTPGFLMILPEQSSEFYKIDMAEDKQDELKKAEE